MSDLKITLNGKPIGEAMNERIEKKFYEQIFIVTETITESTDEFILTTIAGSYSNQRRLPKERVRRAFDLLLAEDEGRITERKTGRWISHIEHGIYGDIQCWVCSECRELFSHDAETGIEITDYRLCPKCGAEMKGGEQNGSNKSDSD